MTPSYQLWFAVRYVHLVTIAVLLGGAAVMCMLCARPACERDDILRGASAYEWMFWSLAGIVVVTGISNLGLKGDGLMTSHTDWGRALMAKLALVVLLLAFSLTRSDLIIRCARTSVAAPDRVRGVLGSMYGLTVVILLVTLWIGLGLAHGRY